MSVNFQPQPARADALEYFRIVLEDRKVQIFEDSDTGLQLGVFIPSPAIEGRLRDLLSLQPQYSSHSTIDVAIGSSQQYDPVDDADLINAEQTAQTSVGSRQTSVGSRETPPAENEEDPEPLDEEPVYTTTNKNRDRIRKVKAKQLKAAEKQRKLKRKLSARRVVDTDDEVEETVVDEWFQGRRDPEDRFIPLQLQKMMRRNALAIAGQECAYDWQELYKYWRTHGQLTSRPTSSAGPAELTHLQHVGPEVRDFCHAYAHVDAVRTAESIRAIAHRFRMAGLHRLYCAIPDDELGEAGPGVRIDSLRRRFLFRMVHPDLAEPTEEKSSYATQKWRQLGHDLEYAKRWSKIEAELGPGFFGLIPNQKVSTSWIEQRLTVGQLDIWIQAIKHYKPTIQKVSARWLGTILRARQGKGLSSQPRLLEGVKASTVERESDTTKYFQEDTDLSGSEDPVLERDATAGEETRLTAANVGVHIINRETPDFFAAVQNLSYQNYEDFEMDPGWTMLAQDPMFDFYVQLEHPSDSSNSSQLLEEIYE